jgi:hypothetical protein
MLELFISINKPSVLLPLVGIISTGEPILFFRKLSVDEKFLFNVCDKICTPSIFKTGESNSKFFEK